MRSVSQIRSCAAESKYRTGDYERVASFVSQPPERLSDSRYVFVIIGCLLNASDELLHGEIRDCEDHLCARFRSWEELPDLVHEVAAGRPEQL